MMRTQHQAIEYVRSIGKDPFAIVWGYAVRFRGEVRMMEWRHRWEWYT
jgi:hypothetical protein